MNKITAITVSKNYADLLELCIKHNHEIFHKWYIVTQEDDTKTVELIKYLNYSNVKLFYYPLVPHLSKPEHTQMPFTGDDSKILYNITGHDLITCDELINVKTEYNKDTNRIIQDNKIHFDKGGAVRYLQNQTSLNENVLILDSDILISEKLKHKILHHKLNQNTIYGCHRIDFQTYNDAVNNDLSRSVNYDRNDKVDGYFQLYINNNTFKYHRSFNASACDANFTRQFQDKKHVFTEYCYHVGEGGVNWNGRKI